MVLITIGVVLLLNQMGRLPGDFWWTVWRYWPVILILAGIEVLLGISRSRWMYLLGVILAIGVVGGLVAYAVLRGDGLVNERPAGATETIMHAVQDAGRAKVNLRMAGGAIELGSLSDSANLAEARIQYSKRSNQVDDRYAMRNGQAEWTLRSRQASSLVASGDEWSDKWTVKLNGRIPLELDVELAAGRIDADLRALRVSRVDVDVAAGSATIRLPEAEGTTEVTVKIAVGEITIIAPVGVGIRVWPSKLLGSLNITGHQLIQSGKYWVTDNYAAAASKLDLRAEVVLGSINLR
jgi:hypothetical protein